MSGKRRAIKKSVENGDLIRDKVTGLEGISTGVVTYLNGCVQHVLSPAVDKEGKKPESWWIDEGQLEVLSDDPHGLRAAEEKRAASQEEPQTPVKPRRTGTGGPSDSAPPTSYTG